MPSVLVPGPTPKTTLQQLFITCEALYQRDGFVRWADVGKTHGITRQAVQLRLRRAVETGELDTTTFQRWQSMSTRRTETAKRANDRERARRKLDIRISVTPENKAWLEAQRTERGITGSDIINGLLNKARMQ